MHELFFFIIWILAGFITGVSGLGAAMVAVPLLSLFLEPHTLIPISTALVSVLCLELGYIYRKDLLRTDLKNMILGSLPGLFLGTCILVIIPAETLLLTIGIIMILFVFWQFLHKIPEKPRAASRINAVLAGFISGTLSTSVSFGGPPCAVYALYSRWTQKQTLATINIFVGLSSFLGFFTLLAADLINKEVLYWTVIGIPAVSLGITFSIPVSRVINIYLFRIILLIIIAFGGLGCIVKSLC